MSDSRRRSASNLPTPDDARATDARGDGHAAEVQGSLAIALPLAPATCAPATFTPPPFDDVYDAWFDFVWRSARRLGVAEASVDDVVQDVFVVVHRRLPAFEGRSTIKTWLFAIVLRVVSDYRRTLRRKGGLSPLADEMMDPGAPSPAACVEQAEATRVLYGLLDDLDDPKRTVFVLAELEEQTAPEIAETLGIPLNTVYSRLRAARIEFEKALARRHARERSTRGGLA